MRISSSINQGILSLPGRDAASKAAAEQLLTKDYVDNHCYFHSLGLHNHISHHILAAYDLGASGSLLQAIYDDEMKIQRPIDLKENGVIPEGVVRPGEMTQENWTKWLGDPQAYAAYVAFFSDEVATLGVAKSLEEYVFSPAANGNGAYMLFRFFGGLLHPFIQVGYGLEFDNEVEIAAGLASAAIHFALEGTYISPEEYIDAPPSQGTSANDNGRRSNRGPSILSLLRMMYDSPKLVPQLPYDRDRWILDRPTDLLEYQEGSIVTEFQRILSHFDPGETAEDFEALVEEFMFASTLLTFATGKEGKKPRVDFCLVHLLTSSLFVPAFVKCDLKVEHKRALLRTLLMSWGTIIMIIGRPRIDASLLMSYTDRPLPPETSLSDAHPSGIDGTNLDSVNPWPAMIADALHAPDAHTLKAIRSLLFGATKYGTLDKGDIIGAYGDDGKETHPGIASADGTIFVRATGVLMNSLGWVTHGKKAGAWDRTGLGWDDAWRDEDE